MAKKRGKRRGLDSLDREWKVRGNGQSCTRAPEGGQMETVCRRGTGEDEEVWPWDQV